METKNFSFNPSDFIRFVEPDPRNTSPKAMAFTVKITNEAAQRWRTHCDRYGLHKMRALRDCFAAGMRSHLEASGEEANRARRAHAEAAAGGLASREPPGDAYAPWRPDDAAPGAKHAAADDSDSRFGF